MIGYIYQILNTITNQCYIGQTINLNGRQKTHYNELRRNGHENPKLQNAWNYYGEDAFRFISWTFDISNEKELDDLEIEYIKKFDSIENGYNIAEGGSKPPNPQTINDEDIIAFMCIQNKYGDGYGKTYEQLLNWSHGTASRIKRHLGYAKAISKYEQLSNKEKEKIAVETYNKLNLEQNRLKRQLNQGGCAKAYQLKHEDYLMAFCAKDLGYTSKQIANFLGIKIATVYDWFNINKPSRKKEREEYYNLSDEEKKKLSVLVMEKISS